MWLHGSSADWQLRSAAAKRACLSRLQTRIVEQQFFPVQPSLNVLISRIPALAITNQSTFHVNITVSRFAHVITRGAR